MIQKTQGVVSNPKVIFRCSLIELTNDDAPLNVVYFSINPSDMSDEKESVWTKTSAPGLPYKYHNWAGGGERKIAFTLNLETYEENDAIQIAGLGVVPYVKALQRFLYPESFGIASLGDVNFNDPFMRKNMLSKMSGGLSNQFVPPPKAILVWGTYYTLDVIVESIKFKYTAFNSRGNPTRGTAEVVLSEVESGVSGQIQSVFRSTLPFLRPNVPLKVSR